MYNYDHNIDHNLWLLALISIIDGVCKFELTMNLAEGRVFRVMFHWVKIMQYELTVS